MGFAKGEALTPLKTKFVTLHVNKKNVQSLKYA